MKITMVSECEEWTDIKTHIEIMVNTFIKTGIPFTVKVEK